VALSYGIQPLPITKALELYDLLGEYLPEFDAEMQVLDFVGTIVDNIVEAKSTAYADALCLMTTYDFADLSGFSAEVLLEMFAIGLTANDIIGLKKFCEDIGYAYRRRN
jgi:hypothetical protein